MYTYVCMCVCFVVVVIGVVVAVVVLSYDTLSLYLLFRNTGRNQRNEFVKVNKYRLVFLWVPMVKYKECIFDKPMKIWRRIYNVTFEKTRTTIAIKITRKTTNVFLVIKTNWKQFNPTTLLHSVIFIDWTYWDWFLCCLCVCVVIYSALPFC